MSEQILMGAKSALETERDALRAQLAEAQKSATRGWEQADSLHINLREQRERAEQAEAQLAEAQRERDEARILHDDALRQASEHAFARTKAEAENTQLRKVLRRLLTEESLVSERGRLTDEAEDMIRAALAGKGARRE